MTEVSVSVVADAETLARTVAEQLLDRLGSYAPVTPDVVAALSRGDRDRLVLAVRAGLAGDEIRLIATCPNPDCGELVEVVLSIADLLAGERPGEPGRGNET